MKRQRDEAAAESKSLNVRVKALESQIAENLPG